MQLLNAKVLKDYLHQNPWPEKDGSNLSDLWLASALFPLLETAQMVKVQGVFKNENPCPVVFFELMQWDGKWWSVYGETDLDAMSAKITKVFRGIGDKSDLDFLVSVSPREVSLDKFKKDFNFRSPFLFSPKLPILEAWQNKLKTEFETMLQRQTLNTALPTSKLHSRPTRL